MKEIECTPKLLAELSPYFLQKNIFRMLINYVSHENHSKIGTIKNVNNSTIRTFSNEGVGKYIVVLLNYIVNPITCDLYI